MIRWWSVPLLPLLAMAGCHDAPPPPSSPPPVPHASLDTVGVLSRPTGGLTRPAQMAVVTDDGPSVIALDVYELTVPLGAISRSEEFWKRVDETAIDVPTYDLLLKNAVRVGIGDNKDWPFFKSLIDKHHATAMRGSSSPTARGFLELQMKGKIDSEDVFWTNDQDVLYGRTFEDCENLVSINFEPHQRKINHAILNICPMVRGTRKHLRYTVLNKEEAALEAVYPEQLMDMQLEADVPPDHFMIFSPTGDARVKCSVGRTFFVKNGPAQELETVLILAPRTLRLSAMH